MRTKFDIGEKVFVKDWGVDVDKDAFTVQSITIGKTGTTYDLKDGHNCFLRAKESELESVVQK